MESPRFGTSECDNLEEFYPRQNIILNIIYSRVPMHEWLCRSILGEFDEREHESGCGGSRADSPANDHPCCDCSWYAGRGFEGLGAGAAARHARASCNSSQSHAHLAALPDGFQSQDRKSTRLNS